jgi:hypothetical protein
MQGNWQERANEEEINIPGIREIEKWEYLKENWRANSKLIIIQNKI